MDKKLQKAFNDQIKHEFYSAYLYLSMAAYFESLSLEGFAHWMKVQVKEEQGHGMKMFDFLHDRGVKVALQAIGQPAVDFSSPQEVFAEALAHEKKVTALINELYDIAEKTDDKAACIFLQWFITEQVEEEKNVTKVIEMLKHVKPDSAGMIMIDHRMGKREA
jgi:ferritin